MEQHSLERIRNDLTDHISVKLVNFVLTGVWHRGFSVDSTVLLKCGLPRTMHIQDGSICYSNTCTRLSALMAHFQMYTLLVPWRKVLS